MKFISTDDLLTTTAVARLTDRSQTAVRGAINTGRLPARKIGGTWRVRRSEALAWNKRTGRRRRAAPRTSDRTARLLAEHGPLTAGALARLVPLHPGNVRRHLSILEAEGRAARLEHGEWVLLDAATGAA